MQRFSMTSNQSRRDCIPTNHGRKIVETTPELSFADLHVATLPSISVKQWIFHTFGMLFYEWISISVFAIMSEITSDSANECHR